MDGYKGYKVANLMRDLEPQIADVKISEYICNLSVLGLKEIGDFLLEMCVQKDLAVCITFFEIRQQCSKHRYRSQRGKLRSAD